MLLFWSNNPQSFLHLNHKIIDLLGVRKGLGHTLVLQTSLSPTYYLWTLSFNAKFPYCLICIEPAVKSNQCNVYKSQTLTSKIFLFSKNLFQLLQYFYELFLSGFMLFSLGSPYLPCWTIKL